MALPQFPANLLPRPFADNGTYAIIPDESSASGRASFKDGFPVETQLPLANGGVAPSRPDFNGVYHMLSAFAFWQQSGGQSLYKEVCNYQTPNLVFRDGILWWCVKANGPDTADGVKTPGAQGSEEFWISFLDYLTGNNGGKSVTLGNPVGTIIMFYGTTAPDGYFPCDGEAFDTTKNPKLFQQLGVGVTPDLRGYFLRGADTRTDVDPDGNRRAIGSRQNDAIRPITGQLHYVGGPLSPPGVQASGAFSASNLSRTAGSQGGCWFSQVTLDVSAVVPTAPENRPKNKTVLYCIRHD